MHETASLLLTLYVYECGYCASCTSTYYFCKFLVFLCTFLRPNPSGLSHIFALVLALSGFNLPYTWYQQAPAGMSCFLFLLCFNINSTVPQACFCKHTQQSQGFTGSLSRVQQHFVLWQLDQIVGLRRCIRNVRAATYILQTSLLRVS